MTTPTLKNTPAKASDFHVGQLVACADLDAFCADKRDFLTGRTGLVETIYPDEPPDRDYAGHVNVLLVRWLKRDGLGKEKTLRMEPRLVKPVSVAGSDSKRAY